MGERSGAHGHAAGLSGKQFFRRMCLCLQIEQVAGETWPPRRSICRWRVPEHTVETAAALLLGARQTGIIMMMRTHLECFRAQFG